MTNVTVAIVDDHARVRDSIAELLLAVGYSVQTFRSGEEFVAYCHDDGWMCLSCLVLDVRLPGINGIELLSELSRRAIAMPVVLISGHATHEVAELGRRHGAATLLEKPFDGETLVEEIVHAMQAFARPTGRERPCTQVER